MLELIIAFGTLFIALFMIILFYASLFACMLMLFIFSLSLGKFGAIILWVGITLAILIYGIYKDHKKMIAWIKGLGK
jgi:hypothetical protein